MTRLEQQVQFIREIDKVKNIYRQTYLADGRRKENDAEHSWHIALMAVLLQEYVPDADAARVMTMVLIHDLVEIDAGDTYAYDSAGAETKRVREAAAADRIFGLLPVEQGQEFRRLWEEFEEYETPDAKFAHLLDNFQPLLLNNANDGGDWRVHRVSRSQVWGRQAKTELGSAEIWEYTRGLIEENVRKGNIKEDKPV